MTLCSKMTHRNFCMIQNLAFKVFLFKEGWAPLGAGDYGVAPTMYIGFKFPCFYFSAAGHALEFRLSLSLAACAGPPPNWAQGRGHEDRGVLTWLGHCRFC